MKEGRRGSDAVLQKGRHAWAGFVEKRRPDDLELAVHAAYWKYSVLRRLRGSERGSFPQEGSNWFPIHDIYHAGQIQLLKRLRG